MPVGGLDSGLSLSGAFQMTIIIGIVPHEASHTAVAIDDPECVLDE